LKKEAQKLKYRKPNLVEMYDYLDQVGGFSETNVFKLKAMCINAIAPYVNYAECGYETYNDLLLDTEKRGLELAQLADKFYAEIIGVFAKKN
jgi:hypothetical protein